MASKKKQQITVKVHSMTFSHSGKKDGLVWQGDKHGETVILMNTGHESIRVNYKYINSTKGYEDDLGTGQSF